MTRIYRIVKTNTKGHVEMTIQAENQREARQKAPSLIGFKPSRREGCKGVNHLEVYSERGKLLARKIGLMPWQVLMKSGEWKLVW